MNELLLAGSVLLIFGAVLLSYRILGRQGLYAVTAIATILANIEVLMVINAFGMEQTLGNVMFASTYLVTDILSENEGKEYASKAVKLGVFTSVIMFLFTQYWLLYTPAQTDWAAEHIREIFSTTPRLLIASFLGYVISQRFDVWLYHRIWEFTEKKSGSKKAYLWLRNNGSTMVSQLINTFIFTFVAFTGWYDAKTLISILVSSYIIYIFTSLLDTPVVYIARMLKEKGVIPEK
ncbi:MAG: queuosine precursor transporter [Oscillospiraceae bacterium]|nr:queuosine precursor transporter [Oscillospiraceae bacterium]